MKTRCLFTLLACLLAATATAQTDLTNQIHDIYVESPIYAKSETSRDQTTFAAMRAPIIKKLGENPKVRAVEDRNCTYKLLTIIQNYRRFTQRDSTNGKFYYKLEFNYIIAIKNTQTNEAVAQGMTKKGYAESEKSYADALAIACNKLPYESDLNEVIEEAFALVGLITKIEPDPKKPKRAGNVYIDLGTNHGVRKNQWFDVFLVKDGNVSDRIATLHLDKAEATFSISTRQKPPILYARRRKTRNNCSRSGTTTATAQNSPSYQGWRATSSRNWKKPWILSPTSLTPIDNSYLFLSHFQQKSFPFIT